MSYLLKGSIPLQADIVLLIATVAMSFNAVLAHVLSIGVLFGRL